MLHSIIRFVDADGKMIDFHRLKQKKPETVLQKVLEGFSMYGNTFHTEAIKERCRAIKIHCTEYESTEANKTFECTYTEFLNRLKAYKNN